MDLLKRMLTLRDGNPTIQEAYDLSASADNEVYRLYVAYRVCGGLSDIGIIVRKVWANLENITLNPEDDTTELLTAFIGSNVLREEHEPSKIFKSFYTMIDDIHDYIKSAVPVG